VVRGKRRALEGGNHSSFRKRIRFPAAWKGPPQKKQKRATIHLCHQEHQLSLTLERPYIREKGEESLQSRKKKKKETLPEGYLLPYSEREPPYPGRAKSLPGKGNNKKNYGEEKCNSTLANFVIDPFLRVGGLLHKKERELTL